MMCLTFGLFTQVSVSGPRGPLVLYIKSQNHFSNQNTEIICRSNKDDLDLEIMKKNVYLCRIKCLKT